MVNVAKKTFDGEVTEITWTFFKWVFLKKFIPEHIRYQKMREFQTFVQGRMTVMEFLKSSWSYSIMLRR